MLGQKEDVATLAVRDLAAARKFYEGVLELKVATANEPAAVTYASGSSKVIVYQSQLAGTNKATAANWLVGGDIDRIAGGLKSRGVVFEDYGDVPGLTKQGDLYVAGSFKTAWFKDPDGNVLCLMNV